MEARNCADCPAVLEEHKGAGRPRVRCQLCSAKRARALRAERKRRQKEDSAETDAAIFSPFSSDPSPNEPGYSAYSPTWRSPFTNTEEPEDDESPQTFVDFD